MESVIYRYRDIFFFFCIADTRDLQNTIRRQRQICIRDNNYTLELHRHNRVISRLPPSHGGWQYKDHKVRHRPDHNTCCIPLIFHGDGTPVAGTNYIGLSLQKDGFINQQGRHIFKTYYKIYISIQNLYRLYNEAWCKSTMTCNFMELANLGEGQATSGNGSRSLPKEPVPSARTWSLACPAS